jgi:NRPS condensation-like uncharacterized protein
LLGLYYWRPTTFVFDHQVKIYRDVRSQREFDEQSEAWQSEVHEVNGCYASKWAFFPNYENGPTVIFGIHHARADGTCLRTLFREFSDAADELPKRSWWAYLKQDIKVWTKCVLNYGLLSAVAERVVAFADEPPTLMDPVPFSKAEESNFRRVTILGLDLTNTLGVARKHNFTVNDVVQASYAAAFHRIHNRRNIDVKAVNWIISVDLRGYTEPFRLTVETSKMVQTLPVAEVSFDLIQQIHDAMVVAKSRMPECYASTLSRLTSKVYDYKHQIEGTKRLMSKFSCRSSNIRGVDNVLYYLGHKVENIWMDGVHC